MHCIEVKSPFVRRGEIVHPGRILVVNDDVLAKLGAHVGVIPVDRIGRTIFQRYLSQWVEEVDTLGYPWPVEFSDWLNKDERAWLQENERHINKAALDGDMAGLSALLDARKRFLLDRRGTVQRGGE